jgi:hypothetical protein
MTVGHVPFCIIGGNTMQFNITGNLAWCHHLYDPTRHNSRNARHACIHDRNYGTNNKRQVLILMNTWNSKVTKREFKRTHKTKKFTAISKLHGPFKFLSDGTKTMERSISISTVQIMIRWCPWRKARHTCSSESQRIWFHGYWHSPVNFRPRCIMAAFAVLLIWTPDQTIQAFGKCPTQHLPTFSSSTVTKIQSNTNYWMHTCPNWSN